MLERIGKYEVLELLAGGGQGTVYRARDTEGGEVVALKVMHPGHTGEAQYLRLSGGRPIWHLGWSIRM